MARRSDCFIGTILCLNILVSVAIVGVNKYVYTHYGFPNLTLTMIHFVVTFLGLLICRLFGIFRPKNLPVLRMLPLSLTFCGFVALTNLSLQFNTVGTYQVLKTLTTPCIMTINAVAYGKPSSWRLRLTFLPVVVGVALNSHYDLKFSPIGMAFAAAGVLVTSLYQIWVGTFQSNLQCDSAQLLFYQAPLSALLLLPPIAYFEPPSSVSLTLSSQAVGMVGLSAGIAFLVNLSIYWIIGNTSALTYNMAGHLKFCSALTLGYLIFNDPISLEQVMAILLVCLGVFAYSWVKLREDIVAKAATQLPTTALGQQSVKSAA
ncbi:hypothetical protein BOX15_Mlig009768g2 [Macrostomum lignano]|uniref:Sugar phosphate transporter domain-containing protein n=2 Tax=Macrostomum lignano TaxID=282301 RepID=A0A267GZ17_9PLAT|nr:hypothetical protein BOX15_Mlig029261g14 [Macrostomum lignano]PAA91291.1 hypothetical protein BOX15_Mlig009768g2 [Macrostomum lignano]